PNQPLGGLGSAFNCFDFCADMLERCLRMIDQLQARICQAKRAGGAMHQLDAQMAFQLLNALTDRGLAHAQAFSSSGITTLLGKNDQAVYMRPETFVFGSFHRFWPLLSCPIVWYFKQQVQFFALGKGQGLAYTGCGSDLQASW